MDAVPLLIISCSYNSMFSEQHTFSTTKLGMDKVKLSFINQMKKSLNELTPFSVESSSIRQRSSETSSLNQFSEQGQALPVRQNFWFSSKQRNILYKCFINDETSGKDLSAEQIHLSNRAWNRSWWVCYKPVDQSLFSRWSRIKKDDLLKSVSQENNKE